MRGRHPREQVDALGKVVAQLRLEVHPRVVMTE